jgi:hypothetical protein
MGRRQLQLETRWIGSLLIFGHDVFHRVLFWVTFTWLIVVKENGFARRITLDSQGQSVGRTAHSFGVVDISWQSRVIEEHNAVVTLSFLYVSFSEISVLSSDASGAVVESLERKTGHGPLE